MSRWQIAQYRTHENTASHQHHHQAPSRKVQGTRYQFLHKKDKVTRDDGCSADLLLYFYLLLIRVIYVAIQPERSSHNQDTVSTLFQLLVPNFFREILEESGSF